MPIERASGWRARWIRAARRSRCACRILDARWPTTERPPVAHSEGPARRWRARRPLRPAHPAAAPGDEPRRPLVGARRHRRVLGHLRIHEAVRAARPQGPRRRGADHRSDRPAVSSRSWPSPTKTAPACSSSAAMRCCSGSRAAATSMRACRASRAHAPRAARRRPHRRCRARRSRCACRRASTPARSTSSRSARRIIELLPTGPALDPAGRRWSTRPRPARSWSARRPRRCCRRGASAQPRDRACCCCASRRAHGQDAADPAARPLPHETLARCLSPAVRAHVMGGGGTPEHRPVTIAFIRFEGTDAMIEQRRRGATADALHRAGHASSKRRPRHRTSRSSPPTSTPTAASSS